MKKTHLFIAMCFMAFAVSAQDYVDLGLPSGTLWKTVNEEGLFSCNKAFEKYGTQMPTKEQWEELIKNCEWTWEGNGYKVTSVDGIYIFLPAEGSLSADPFGEINKKQGVEGNYWSCTQGPSKGNDAWYLYFYSTSVDMKYCQQTFQHSVRLVKKQ